MKSMVCEKARTSNAAEEREQALSLDMMNELQLEATANGGEKEQPNSRRRNAGGHSSAAPAAARKRKPLATTAGAVNGLARPKLRKEKWRDDDAWFRALFEHLPEPVFLLDPHDPQVLEPIVQCNGTQWHQDGKTHEFAWSLEWPILECNRAACRRHGYLPGELDGQPAGLVGPLTTHPEDLLNLLKRLATEPYVRFQALSRGKDGTVYPVEVATSRIHLGGREKVVLLSRDMSATQPVERGTLTAFGRQFPGPHLEIDVTGKIIFSNAAADALVPAPGAPTLAAMLPRDIAAQVKECLASRRERLGFSTNLAGRTIWWALYPMTGEQAVYAQAIDLTGWVREDEAKKQDIDSALSSAGTRVVTPVAPDENEATQNDARGNGWSAGELMEAAAGAMAACDVHGNFQLVNMAMAQLTGHGAGELAGRRIIELAANEAEALSWWMETCEQVYAGRVPKAKELTLLRKGGGAVAVEILPRAIQREGQVTGIHLTLRELALHAPHAPHDAAGTKREARLALIEKVGHVGSWELSVATGALDWSEETHRIFKRPAGEFIPTNESFFELVHPVSRDKVRQVRERALQQGEAYCVEYRIAEPGEAERWVLEQGEATRDEAGKVTRLAGTVQDITKRKQEEEQARHVEKWEAIGRMAGGVAHDFNSILADIRRCTELLQAVPNVNQEITPQLRQLAMAAERATNLTWHLLSLSKKQTASPDALDLNKLINAATEVLHHVLQPDIHLDLRLNERLPQVPAHPQMLEQVLLNLAINSRYAMPRGGRLLIETRDCEIDAAYIQQQPEAKAGRYVCLRVNDNGGGVNAARMSCLHEPFFTARNVGQGTGLGLATIHGIIKQHQGWIDVSSEMGQGTTFRVYLPVNPAKADMLSAERPHKPISGGSETLLLVEGDPLLRALARSILQRYGYQVLEAGSNAEALTVWGLNPEIHLLVTDMGGSPELNGLELARQLEMKTPKLKVLYASGYSSGLTQPGCTLRPGLNFLPKPYSATALAQAARNCLDRAEPGRGGTQFLNNPQPLKS